MFVVIIITGNEKRPIILDDDNLCLGCEIIVPMQREFLDQDTHGGYFVGFSSKKPESNKKVWSNSSIESEALDGRD